MTCAKCGVQIKGEHYRFPDTGAVWCKHCGDCLRGFLRRSELPEGVSFSVPYVEKKP